MLQESPARDGYVDRMSRVNEHPKRKARAPSVRIATQPIRTAVPIQEALLRSARRPYAGGGESLGACKGNGPRR